VAYVLKVCHITNNVQAPKLNCPSDTPRGYTDAYTKKTEHVPSLTLALTIIVF